MRTLFSAVVIAGMLLIFTPGLQAADHAGHSGSKDQAMDMNMPGMAKEAPPQETFMKQEIIDGYTVTFHVMKSAPGMDHGGSHNLMVKVEKDGSGQILDKIMSKVIWADGTDQQKQLFKMDDWYMNGFDLGSPGQHQLIILFKTADGTKHNGGVYFEAPPEPK